MRKGNIMKVTAFIGSDRKRHFNIAYDKFLQNLHLWLMIYRTARRSIYKMLDDSCRDYTYFRDKKWFESDYFYPVKLNPFKKLTGKIFGKHATQIIMN